MELLLECIGNTTVNSKLSGSFSGRDSITVPLGPPLGGYVRDRGSAYRCPTVGAELFV